MRGRTAESLSGIVMNTEKPTRFDSPKACNPIDAHIASRILRRRELAGMALETLAQRADLPVTRVKAIEAGSVSADASEVYAIAGALGVQVRYFYEVSAVAPVKAAKSWIRDVERWFGANISPYERDFLGIARRLTGDLDSARDVVHDAYAKVLAGETWSTLTHPRAYVMRVVYNLGLNRLRDAKVVPIQQYARVETVSYADMGPDAFETLSSRQEVERLMDAIANLPPQCRKVVTMRKIDELRPREIAQRLNISLSAVEKHLARGLVLLANHLDIAEVETGIANATSDVASAPK